MRLFSWRRPLCTQTLPRRGRLPSTILGVRKLQTVGYPMVKTASVCYAFPRFDTIPECDGRTNGRICYFLFMLGQSLYILLCSTVCLLSMFYINYKHLPFQLILGENRQNHDFDETFTLIRQRALARCFECQTLQNLV